MGLGGYRTPLKNMRSFNNTNKFNKYINSNSIKRIHTGSIWTEGPCYFMKSNKVIWSDIPNNRILSYDFNKVQIFRYPSNFSNGNCIDNEENLITCEHGTRRVIKTDHKDNISLISDEYKDKRLNSPNDICVHSNGAIFFTDPPYGIIDHDLTRTEGFPGKIMYGGCYVFKCYPPSRELTAVVTDMDRPNGIAFSLDEKKLYISNSGIEKYIRVYDVGENLNLSNPQEFAKTDDENTFDGLRIDEENNVWASCGKGIKCFAPNGETLGYLSLPEVVSNLNFGGKKGDIIFITATSSLYMINLNLRGAKFIK